MLIIVDQNNGVPVYRQIVDQIRFHVATGIAREGDELPSTRALSQRLGVNPMTVSKAYSLLEEEGLLDRRPGVPLTVRKQPRHSAGHNRLEQLRAVLDPAVASARQLGISPRKAADLFHAMMQDATTESETKS
jgi:GntR family transcriptional regulator